MKPSDYVELAMRTECDQEAAARRLSGAVYHVTVNDTRPARLNHAVLGMVGEVGELASAVEKWIYYGRDLDKVNVAEELCDLLWRFAQACSAMGFDPEALMECNIAKLKIRYPHCYNSEACAMRDREAEMKPLRDYVLEGIRCDSQLSSHARPVGWNKPPGEGGSEDERGKQDTSGWEQDGHGWAEPPVESEGGES